MTRDGGPVRVSVINMKGGVGKTTIAALLGRHASMEFGLEVLAVDLDPQANLSQAFMRESYRQFLDHGSPSIVEIFGGHRPPTSSAASPRRLDIERVVVGDTALGGPDLKVIPPRFDFCAPTESIFTQAAYHASRYVLVPVKPGYFMTKQESKSPNHVIGVLTNNSTYRYRRGRDRPPRSAKESGIGHARRRGRSAVCGCILEILPRPPDREERLLTRLDWPLGFRTSSSQAEGAERDFGVTTSALRGRNSRVEALACARVEWRRDELGGPPRMGRSGLPR